MTIRLLKPHGNDPAGKVVSVSRPIGVDLIQRGIASDLGNVDGWARPVHDKMERGEEVATK